MCVKLFQIMMISMGQKKIKILLKNVKAKSNLNHKVHVHNF